MDIENEIKALERQQAKIAAEIEAKRGAAEAARAARLEEEKKIEGVFKTSGFATPRALIVALMDRYGIRSVASAEESTEKVGRRKRTKVTAELRDQIREKVNGGVSKNQIKKDFEVSYAVVNKVMDGSYDSL